jgi:hypothetical protein
MYPELEAPTTPEGTHQSTFPKSSILLSELQAFADKKWQLINETLKAMDWEAMPFSEAGHEARLAYSLAPVADPRSFDDAFLHVCISSALVVGREDVPASHFNRLRYGCGSLVACRVSRYSSNDVFFSVKITGTVPCSLDVAKSLFAASDAELIKNWDPDILKLVRTRS